VKRIIIHWTAGTHNVSKIDREHYHFIIAGDGTVANGNKPPEANLSTKDGEYAAHTLGCNTGSIGVSLAAMAGAIQRPFSAGQYPITRTQLDALAGLVSALCQKYGIPVTRETVLTHAEVQPTLGIKQRGKWDIAWLPGDAGVSDPVLVGDHIRAVVARKVPTSLQKAQRSPTTLRNPQIAPQAARARPVYPAPVPPKAPTSPPVSKKPGVGGKAGAIGAVLLAIGAAVAAFWDKIASFFGG
jgi:N-acetylmuramoyl-L-alanine amidase